MSKKMKANMLLLITAIIWGTAFVAQKSGGEIGSFTFNGIRTFIGGLVLLPFVFKGRKDKTQPVFSRTEIIGGLVCGAFLFVAASLQQFGLAYTTAGKAAFITTLYVVFCPILSLIVHKKKTRPLVWLCVGLDIIGLYLLCMKSGQGGLNGSDLILLLCAFLFSLQIMAVSFCLHFTDGVRLAVMQTVVTAVLSSICVLLFEHPTAEAVRAALPALLYAGLFSSAVGFTLQIIAQERLEPTVASLIMCLESVFSAVGGWLLLGQALNTREIAGCVLMFAAIVLSQIPSRNESGAEGAGAA